MVVNALESIDSQITTIFIQKPFHLLAQALQIGYKGVDLLSLGGHPK